MAYVHKARALLGLGQVYEAEEVLLKAQDKFKDSLEVSNSLGEVLVMKKDFETAEKVFNGILKKHPKSPEVYLNKGLTRHDTQRRMSKQLKNI